MIIVLPKKNKKTTLPSPERWDKDHHKRREEMRRDPNANTHRHVRATTHRFVLTRPFIQPPPPAFIHFIHTGVVIAKSSKIVYVDGNAYFPVNDVKMEYFSKTDFHTRCSWKGEADYYNVDIGGVKLENAAWQYPADTCTDACKDAGIAGYISFYTHKGVTVK